MSRIFVDTSGWGNLIDLSQPYHTLATDLYRKAKQQPLRLITSNYVLAELVALLESPLRIPRTRLLVFLKGLRASPSVEILHVDLDIDAEAWRLLETRLDKS